MMFSKKPEMLARSSSAAALLTGLMVLTSGVAAAQSFTLGFVNIESAEPLQVAAPLPPISPQHLGVRISGITAPAAIELRIYGLKGDGSDSSKNQFQLLLTVPGQELAQHNLSKEPSEIIYALSEIRFDSVIELLARMTTRDATNAGNTSRLTLDRAAALQQTPSMLAKAASLAPQFLNHLANIYQSVRADPGVRNIYFSDLAHGKPPSKPVKFDAPSVPLLGLAVTPQGKLLAWLSPSEDGFDLWSSPVSPVAPQKILHSSDPLEALFFLDEGTVIFLRKSSLAVAALQKPREAKALATPNLLISKLYQARQKDGEIECIVLAQTGESSWLSGPYAVRFDKNWKVVSVARLPDNPYYDSYSVLIEGLPVFFAGTTIEGQGIHYLNSDNTTAMLYKCKDPGLVAVAADGSRVVFAAVE